MGIKKLLPSPIKHLTLLIVLACGCSSVYGDQYQRYSALRPGTSFDCIHKALLDTDYTIADANRDAGFIRARTAKPTGMRLTGEPFHDEITVSIIATESGSDLKVTATDDAVVNKIFEACSSDPAPI